MLLSTPVLAQESDITDGTETEITEVYSEKEDAAEDTGNVFQKPDDINSMGTM